MTPKSKKKTVKLKIKRQDGPTLPGTARWEDFEVSWQPQMNVISALMEIRKNPVTSGGKRVAPIVWDVHDCMLGSRILGGRAMHGGMPVYKYVANRGLTFAENVLLGAKLSEYHTGYRAFSREVLLALPLSENSDDFVFDNQMLAEILWRGFRVGEVSCPTKYFPEASSINFARSVRYGLGCLGTAAAFRLAAWGFGTNARFPRPRTDVR